MAFGKRKNIRFIFAQLYAPPCLIMAPHFCLRASCFPWQTIGIFRVATGKMSWYYSDPVRRKSFPSRLVSSTVKGFGSDGSFRTEWTPQRHLASS